MRALSLTLLLVTFSCSSSSTNVPSGGGGSAGGSGTGGSAGGGGSAGATGLFQCVTDCNSNHTAKDFLIELKNYVCGNSPCEAACQAVCQTAPGLEDPCVQCLFQEDVPSSIVNSCQNKGKPDCVDFAQCLLGCPGV
jgi:hypothetical protein